jgi:hypothetical protein
MSTLKKDKQKVLGEVFDSARVAEFLTAQAPAGIDVDFHALERAYRGMNIDNFVEFLELFSAAGRNLKATNPEGRTLAQIAAEHAFGSDYVAALQQRGG